MKSTIIFTAILLGGILSVMLTFKGYIVYQAKSIKLTKERLSFQNNVCFKEFNTKKTLLLSELKSETISCLESADQLKSDIYQKEFHSKIKDHIRKIFEKCDSEESQSELFKCLNKFTNESQFMKEIEKRTNEVSQEYQNIDKAEHDCLSKNIEESKVKKASSLSDFKNCLIGNSESLLQSFDLDKLKNIYKTLRNCAINRLQDFDKCLEESVKAVNDHKERLIEISAKSLKEINTFDQNKDACLRHFIVGMVFTEFDCTHDFFQKCLIHGFKKSRIEEIDDGKLINELRNLQNALLACRVDDNKTLIEKCISETVLNSTEARFIDCKIRIVSEESLQNRTNAKCIRYIFEEIKFRGLFMDTASKEGYKKCIDRYYVSNTELPALMYVVNKLKMIEIAFVKCTQYLNVPKCLAEIIAANERTFVYIESNYVQFQGLSMKMLKGKHNGGGSALTDLQNYLEMDSELEFELHQLNEIYKSVQTCVKDGNGNADFSKCMEGIAKLENQRDRLIEISERYSEEIKKIDLQENSCFRHFITKIVFPEFNFDLENCFKNGFKKTLLKDNANENLIKEFENLRNSFSICRVDVDKSNIEKCILEKLADSNEILKLLHTSTEENLKKLKSQIDEVFDNENDCIGYVFEKLHFHGLFMNGLTKNNLKICMDKRYVSSTEKALEKDAISKFKGIAIFLNKCTQYRVGAELSKCIAEIIDANGSSLDYIETNFDTLNNFSSAAIFSGSNYNCLSEIMSRKDTKLCFSNTCTPHTYPDIERCITNWIYVFEPNDIEIREMQLNVRYSCTTDTYERYIKDGSNVTVIETYKAWESHTFSFKHIWRKIEEDWNMVYLARHVDKERSEIAWKFDFSKSNLKVKDFSLRFDNSTFEDGVSEVLVRNSEGSKDVIGSKDLVITAMLSDGEGVDAWQHTQLFRQNISSEEYPFDLNVELCF